MAINCYRPGCDFERLRKDLFEHRKGSRVFYALLDFDQSIQLPAEVSVKDCRRPSWEANVGMALYKPDDGLMGEPYYNPFAFDVGTLGNLFRVHFMVSHLNNMLPPLADHWVNRKLSRQFLGSLHCLIG